MAKFTKQQAMDRLQAEKAAGRAVYDALCGTGITAKMAARGGADLICTHILAYFRMQGLSSMAGYMCIGDANAITLELGERSILNVVSECPVIAGLMCSDPTRDMRKFVDRIADVGFDGIMNCPTLALVDGSFRATLEETGMSYQKEIDLLGYASSIGLFTKAFVTNAEEGLAMAEAGVDNIIIHYGNSSGGTIGSKTVMNEDQMVERTATVLDAMLPKYADRIYTNHGGGIETPAEFASFWAREPRLDGYVGGSSAERFPIEESVPAVTKGFKAVTRP